jgi:asparaginyl-tRNA synthetase
VTYTDAMALLQSAPKKVRFEFKPTWEDGLQSEHEKYLAEVVYKRSTSARSFSTRQHCLPLFAFNH